MFRPTRHLAAVVALFTILLLGATNAHAARRAHAHAAAAKCGRADVTHATVCMINVVRRAHRRAPLRLNADSSSARAGHSRDMVRRRYFAHNTPDGLSPTHRVRATGYLSGHSRWLVGETLAWLGGRATPASIVARGLDAQPTASSRAA